MAKPNVTLIINWLTTHDMVRLFATTTVTLATWRRKQGMPYIRIRGALSAKSDYLAYELTKVLLWADTRDKELRKGVLRELKERIGNQ